MDTEECRRARRLLPDKFPAVGQCVHHMEMHPQRPEVLYQQNHCGVYRSDDGGDSWNDISNGLPSRFGFPFTTLPHDGDTVFVIPEESDQARMTADARFGIYRSRNRGESWDRLTNGLPQSSAYLNVMRMAMTTDPLDAPGVYVGTQGGHLCSRAATAATRGRWCSIGCRRSTRWKPRWSNNCRRGTAGSDTVFRPRVGYGIRPLGQFASAFDHGEHGFGRFLDRFEERGHLPAQLVLNAVPPSRRASTTRKWNSSAIDPYSLSTLFW